MHETGCHGPRRAPSSSARGRLLRRPMPAGAGDGPVPLFSQADRTGPFRGVSASRRDAALRDGTATQVGVATGSEPSRAVAPVAQAWLAVKRRVVTAAPLHDGVPGRGDRQGSSGGAAVAPVDRLVLPPGVRESEEPRSQYRDGTVGGRGLAPGRASSDDGGEEVPSGRRSPPWRSQSE